MWFFYDEEAAARASEDVEQYPLLEVESLMSACLHDEWNGNTRSGHDSEAKRASSQNVEGLGSVADRKR